MAGKTDYLKDGFVSKSTEEDIPGPNYEVWITKSCVDVSDQILSVIQSESDPLKRADKVRDVRQEIAQKAQTDAGNEGGIRCDVQEMLPNESYVLFTYERLRDVRIVYVPPKSLGNFGGDTDNFEWPRHTADFTILRAYVGPNGEAAEYSPNNVPFQPKSWLRVQKNGAESGEFVCVLGFPGSTMRYAPTSRLQYSDQVAVPHMVEDFSRKLELIATYEVDSPEAALKLGTSRKGLANELKRSKGKLVMMRKLGLLKERKGEEDELCRLAGEEASSTLTRLEEIYEDFRIDAPVSQAMEACRGIYAGSTLMAVGHSLFEFIDSEKAKDDKDRESAYRNRNLPFLFKRLAKRLSDIHEPHEVAVVDDAIEGLENISALQEQEKEIRAIFGSDIAGAVASSKLRDLDNDKLNGLVDNDELCRSLLEDPFLKCAAVLKDLYKKDLDKTKALMSERDALFAKLLELQRKHSAEGEIFYPDCNGSLRLSAGHVEGYAPEDAVIHKPSTTLAGLLDKVLEARLSKDERKNEEFSCPDRLFEMLSSGNSAINQVPVCMLYSTDTVGGNSGSPVLNANGEFVGINFDRQRQGLMNEFKYSREYSRSIGVDVRYILWMIGEYDKATYLVDELLS